MTRTALTGALVHDGTRAMADHGVLIEDERVAAILPIADLPDDAERLRLDGGTLAPGFVDAQVNGGAGLMLGDARGTSDIRRIVEAHRGLGSTSILPTLVTDTPERTAATIALVARAIADGVQGIAGLHLEGPHLAPARRGAHPPELVRPMTDADEAMLIDAATRLPRLVVTLAPEIVGPERVARLAAAGVVVFLGHSDADYETAMAAFAAGARGVTHLFNAMSPFGSRAPGLVGAALDCVHAHAGLIADGIHVHPRTIATALRAKRGPGWVFVVSDAMAVAGTADDGFDWNNRRIERRHGRLTLPDGTLAGADLDPAAAIATLVRNCDVAPSQAIAMATSHAAEAIGRPDLGRLAPGARADLVHLGDDLAVRGVWLDGQLVASPPPKVHNGV